MGTEPCCEQTGKNTCRVSNCLTMLKICSRLKRTTDVMFGGKQVVVCGYGEVSQRVSRATCEI